MTRREAVIQVLEGKEPPYVPWHMTFTREALDKLQEYFNTQDIDEAIDNHFRFCGDAVGYMEPVGSERYKDQFGVIWNRSVDKDIGVVEQYLLPNPTLKGFLFPHTDDPKFYNLLPGSYEQQARELFQVYPIGFSLFERAWTLRGMENLFIDMVDNPKFVHTLLREIADFNIEIVKRACTYPIDAVYFGDDWGSQHGLLMGPRHWYEFIYPQVKRMYQAVRNEGKYVCIHSCGDVDELFDSLIDAGLSCFNPFQPEVMDVYKLLNQYRGTLAFHGGLSTQQVLPFGSTEDVLREVTALLKEGSRGGYIFSPAHAVEGDVPVENLVVMIEAVMSQERYSRR